MEIRRLKILQFLNMAGQIGDDNKKLLQNTTFQKFPKKISETVFLSENESAFIQV